MEIQEARQEALEADKLFNIRVCAIHFLEDTISILAALAEDDNPHIDFE